MVRLCQAGSLFFSPSFSSLACCLRLPGHKALRPGPPPPPPPLKKISKASKANWKKRTGKRNSGSGSVAPQECLLRSAHTHAAVNAAGDKLKLTIGYTAYEPVGAKVEVRKGSDRIATKSLRLSRSGVLRIVKNLGEGKAPKQLVVRLAVPDSPGYCGKYETEKVRVS